MIIHIFLSLAIKLTTLSIQYREMTHQHQKGSCYGFGSQIGYSRTSLDLRVSVHLQIPSQSRRTGKASIAFGSKIYKGACSPSRGNRIFLFRTRFQQRFSAKWCSLATIVFHFMQFSDLVIFEAISNMLYILSCLSPKSVFEP